MALEDEWEARQQQLLEPFHHLNAVETWTGNAASWAEHDGREQAAAAIWGQVATARAVAALAAAVLRVAAAMESSSSPSSSS